MLEAFQFELRRRFLGRMILRPGLPRVPPATGKTGECAYYRKLLRAATDKRERARVTRLVDVGCRNWSYVQALADCFPKAALLGVELDGYRRYWNMFRRIDYAQAHAATLKRPARAVTADFLALEHLDDAGPGALTLFCFLFPFVTANPALRWGLPDCHANYPALLQHAMALTSGGKHRFLAVHQGDWEMEEARQVYDDAGLDMRAVKMTPKDWAGLWPSPHDNWVCYGGSGLPAQALVH